MMNRPYLITFKRKHLLLPLLCFSLMACDDTEITSTPEITPTPVVTSTPDVLPVLGARSTEELIDMLRPWPLGEGIIDPGFIVDGSFPGNNDNMVIAKGAPIVIEFTEELLEGSITSGVIELIEKDSGQVILGEVELIDELVLSFTPDEALKDEAIYTVNISNSLMSREGNNLVETTFDFSTLPYFLGNTTQSSIDSCGRSLNGYTTKHVLNTNAERLRIAGTAQSCMRFAYTGEIEPLSLDCTLTDTAFLLATDKAATLAPDGSYNPDPWDYNNYLTSEGKDTSKIHKISVLGVNELANAGDFYTDRNLSENDCNIIMSPEANKIGAIVRTRRLASSIATYNFVEVFIEDK